MVEERKTMTRATRPVICIGLDGATWKTLKPWIDSGQLPTFKHLVGKGASGVLNSTIPCLTAPAVASLYTGKNQGNTGVFGFEKPNGALVSANDIRDETIWEIFNRHGYNSCLVNLPITYPPMKLNGVVISGGISSPRSSEYTYPPELKQQIGDFHCEEVSNRTHKLIKDLHKNRMQIYQDRLTQHRTRYKVFKKLLAQNRYDFAMYWEGTTDAIHHYCWDYPELMLNFYKEIEQMLQDLLDSFPETNLIILSDHGAGRSPTHDFNVNAWLRHEGYLEQKGGHLKIALINWTLSLLRKYIPHRGILNVMRTFMKNPDRKESNDGIEQKLSRHKRMIPGIDWSKTAAWLDQSWGIALKKDNPSLDDDKVREEIIGKLNNLKDENGGEIVRMACKKEDLFKGKYIDQIPDIIFLTTEKYWPNVQLSKTILSKRKVKSLVAAEHDTEREGIFIAIGPDIKENFHIGSANLVDIAPTLLHLLECHIPVDMDGRTLTEIFRENSRLATRSAQYAEPIEKRNAVEEGYTSSEEKEVKEKLKELGYL
jgi:predicted AlkP superfamily phosphohydrolase/phosphomutase